MSDPTDDAKALEFLKQIVDQSDEDGFERIIAEARLWLDQLTGNLPVVEKLPPQHSIPLPRIRKNRYGYYCVAVPTPNGRHKLVSTGERVRGPAVRMVRDVGVDRLVLLAKSGSLTAETVVMATTGRRLNCDALLEMWQADLAVSAAASTVETYVKVARALFKKTAAHSRPLVWITRQQLSDYVNEPGRKYSRRNVRKAALHSLYQFAQHRGIVLGNLVATIRIRHQEMTWEEKEPKRVQPITHDEYLKIISSDKITSFDRMATIISYWAGFRLSDVCTLPPAAIQDDSVIVWTRKRKHRLVLPFSNPLIGSPEFIACMRELKANPWTKDWCFMEKFDYEKGQSIVSHHYILVLRKLGIEGKSFHSLRHAAISRFYAAGMSLEEIGGLVGHRTPTTTKFYVHSPAPNLALAAATECEVTA
jgi:site-specific recombinase XerD